MRYRIRHITAYEYPQLVSHCYNIANMLPLSNRRQQCLKQRISVSPTPEIEQSHRDYFANHAYHFEIQRPHKQLTITAESEVETQAQRISDSLDFGLSCQEARYELYQHRSQDNLNAREFVLNSRLAVAHPELLDYAKPCFDDQKPLLSAVQELTAKIYHEFEYCSDATNIATPLSEVMQSRKGVCQDFAHLQIACLRALGFAARYISGYIETLAPPGKEKLVGSDASHAWIAVYSPAEGWIEFDPTNNCLAGEQHIITAIGRDFADVSPLKGVIFGGGQDAELQVSVDVARLA